MSVEWLRKRLSGGGAAAVTERGWRFDLPASDDSRYHLAQVDDYWDRARRDFPWRAPVLLRLRARVSAGAINGTWGFGFWNDPFGLALDPTGRSTRVPTPPQAAWFFFASRRSYLSLRDDLPAHGLLAQVFRSRRSRWGLMRASLLFLFSRRRARRALSRDIGEDAVSVATNPSEWHAYEIEWRVDSCRFNVNGRDLLKTRLSPMAPLAFVTWIDNQFARFDPQGSLEWGVEKIPQPEWLEVEDLVCEQIP